MSDNFILEPFYSARDWSPDQMSGQMYNYRTQSYDEIYANLADLPDLSMYISQSDATQAMYQLLVGKMNKTPTEAMLYVLDTVTQSVPS